MCLICDALNELRAEEGDAVTLLCENPEGPPYQAIDCQGDWTDWEHHRFEGPSLTACLNAAVEAKRKRREAMSRVNVGTTGHCDHGKFQGVRLTNKPPPIMTLCGSSRFCAEMAILAWEFEKGGYITMGLHLLPQGYCEEKGWPADETGNIHHIGEHEGVEEQMDALHFKKIELSDSIYVVNVDGYIGKSTAREIAYAEHLGKQISYLEDPE